MYGYYHPLRQKPEPSKLVWGLTTVQVIALVVGGKLSFMLGDYIPALPFNNFLLSHLHHLMPLAVCMGLVFIREKKTGLTLPKYLYNMAKYRLYRRKTYVWRKI